MFLTDFLPSPHSDTPLEHLSSLYKHCRLSFRTVWSEVLVIRRKVGSQGRTDPLNRGKVTVTGVHDATFILFPTVSSIKSCWPKKRIKLSFWTVSISTQKIKIYKRRSTVLFDLFFFLSGYHSFPFMCFRKSRINRCVTVSWLWFGTLRRESSRGSGFSADGRRRHLHRWISLSLSEGHNWYDV